MIAIAGCQSHSLSTSSNAASATINPPATPIQTTANNSTNSAIKSEISSPISQGIADGIPMTVYQADSQCQAFVSQQVSVPRNQPLESAVGQVLKQTNNGDFEISGYRLSINSKTRVATVDLRLPTNPSRNFASLSSCEKFALFGSLRKTITSNRVLQIKDVKFTNQGAEILF